MAQFGRQTGDEYIVSQKSDTTNDSDIVGFKQLPQELRDEIYTSVTGDLTVLNIPDVCEGTALSFLTQRLPRCLLLNHQIQQEAALAYLHRTLAIMESVTVPSPSCLLQQIPDSITFKGVRRLEFTRPQGHSAIDVVTAVPTSALGAHDVITRCSGLRELTMNVTAGMLFAENQEPNAPRLKTMEEIDESFKFTRILEHNSLQKIQLICYDADKHAFLLNQFYQDIFTPFTMWFMNEAHTRGRKISFNLRICPSWEYSDPDPELSWDEHGYITSYYWRDIFG
ncbi:hypothetical protein BKA66DRAFT_452367 [Pyrenochaeta sp. MPI-SDFR-AT-0127]|nr:hypothetical protein BKA66DRAFT_452367 [Pyrenochaeta sp. MPI-SDFR-AT-0127]